MLRLEHVTIRFGGLVAVNDVSTEIERGDIFGLLGPNGAGKTTMFNIISGVYAPTDGKVIFDGAEIQGKSQDKINQAGIARTYQNINLFNKMTVLENVMIGCYSRTSAGVIDAVFLTKKQREEEAAVRDKCRGLLSFLGLQEKEGLLAKNLPYGDQRRLEIARAMASDPKLLLLDEPAAGMNMNEKNELAEIIRKIRDKGITVLLVEHNMKLVMSVCNHICVLNFGKKLAEGTPEYIQNHEDVIAAYLGGGVNG